MQSSFPLCLSVEREVRNPWNFSLSNWVWALKCDSPQIGCSLHSVTRRSSKAYKQCNWVGVECIRECVCMHMCVCVHTPVRLHTLLNCSKSQGSVGEVCLKPKLRTATSLWWLFPREAWPFIYNTFQPRPLDMGGQRWSCGELLRRQPAAGRHCPRRYFRNVNGMPGWRASEPRAWLSTVLWPSVEAQEVS